MCILFLYTNAAPKPNGYRLIIASNRDEFYRRPAQKLQNLDKVIGGTDMESGREGGMWLGLSLHPAKDSKLRFGALLNVTGEDHKQGAKGRGFIVTDYLRGNYECKEYIEKLLNSGELYNAFNFVSIDVKKSGNVITHHCSNAPTSNTTYEGRQILGFGNTIPQKSLTKVKSGSQLFKDIIDGIDTAKREILLHKLIELLKLEEKHLPDLELEHRQPKGFASLSSIYVKMIEAGYGTRTHSIIFLDYDWNVEFYESTMQEPINPENPIWQSSTFRARL